MRTVACYTVRTRVACQEAQAMDGAISFERLIPHRENRKSTTLTHSTFLNKTTSRQSIDIALKCRCFAFVEYKYDLVAVMTTHLRILK